MQLTLSEQCTKEIINKLTNYCLFEDFKDALWNHYCDTNDIDVLDEDWEQFADDVYEKFRDHYDYGTTWDDALELALDDLLTHGDYVLYDCECEGCDNKMLLRGDDEQKFEINRKRYCKTCYDNLCTKCHKCGGFIDKLNSPIMVHKHYYCSECAAELLNHLVQPDVTQNK